MGILILNMKQKKMNSFFSKGKFGYPWEGTLAVVPRNITPYCPVQPLHHGICWYISRVLFQGYPTFPFDFYSAGQYNVGPYQL